MTTNIEWAITAINEVTKTRTDLQAHLSRLDSSVISESLEAVIESLYEAATLLGNMCGQALVAEASENYRIDNK